MASTVPSILVAPTPHWHPPTAVIQFESVQYCILTNIYIECHFANTFMHSPLYFVLLLLVVERNI